MNPRWWSGWWTHHTRENTCPHPAHRTARQRSNGSSLSYLPTPVFSVLCHFAMPGESWGPQGCPAQGRTGFGGCRAGGCDKHRPRKRRGSPAPGRAAARVRGDLLPLGASFLFSQLEMPAPVSGGRGIPNGVFLFHHVSPEHRGTRGPNPGQGLAPWLHCRSVWRLGCSDHPWPRLVQGWTPHQYQVGRFDFRGCDILKTLLF